MAALVPSRDPASSTNSPSHQPTNAYTAGLPAPPRILIPPPTINPDSTYWAGGSHDGNSQPSLEQLMLAPDTVLPGALQDWKYESRREAQQILPHLFLGPLAASKDTAFLQRHGITLLLAVRASMTARIRLFAQPSLPGVRAESIDVSGHQELIASFQRATEIIDTHYLSASDGNPGGFSVPIDGRRLLAYQRDFAAAHDGAQAPGGKTLVYCESGNERSAAVTAAYLMQHLGGSAVQSIQMVQGKRFCVCFDDAMKWLLTSYEPIWTARRQALGMDAAATRPGGPPRQKRSYDDRDDESEDDNVSANANAQQGKGHAPFLDQGDVEMG